MPRKTIASLEAEIAKLKGVIEQQEVLIDRWQATYKEEKAAHEETVAAIRADTNVYLSYQPSGDTELDALQVAGRAIESLQDPLARDRCAAYLADRFAQED